MLATHKSELASIQEVSSAISAGESLLLAGSRQALEQLPQGDWVGGTIPYFMSQEGGLVSEDRIFMTSVPDSALSVKITDYGEDELANLYSDAPVNGFTFLILPASTDVLKAFAQQAPSLDGFLVRPVVGWVAGVRVDHIGKEQPLVFNGRTGESFIHRGAALHVTLPTNQAADLQIVNIFERGKGSSIRFLETGFKVSTCLIDGEATNLAEYMTSHNVSLKFPLVGDYCGSSINVSVQSVDPVGGIVELYAPVFPEVDYQFASRVEDYAAAFDQALSSHAQQEPPSFACNCILNYLYGDLEGKTTGKTTGPITFGEIAHLLLNQTMVQLHIVDVG